MHKFLGPVLQKVQFAPQVRHLRDGFNVMCDFPYVTVKRSFTNGGLSFDNKFYGSRLQIMERYYHAMKECSRHHLCV